MEDKNIFLLGVGHGTPIFIELAEACGYNIRGLYHYKKDRTGEIDHSYKILGSFDDLFNQDLFMMKFVLTMGDMQIKQALNKKIIQRGGSTPSLIHPSAHISRFSNISPYDVLICNNCEIHNDATIEDGCVLWPHTMIEHDSHIGAYTFMGPRSYIGAYTKVEREAFIGQCSVLISGKARHIGNRAIIGAGSVVTKPVPNKAIVAGNPAKILKYRD